MRSEASWIRFIGPQLLLGSTGLVLGVLGVLGGLGMGADMTADAMAYDPSRSALAQAGGAAGKAGALLAKGLVLLRDLQSKAPPITPGGAGLVAGCIAASLYDLFRLFGETSATSLWRVKIWMAWGVACGTGLAMFLAQAGPGAPQSSLVTLALVLFLASCFGCAAAVLGSLMVLNARRTS